MVSEYVGRHFSHPVHAYNLHTPIKGHGVPDTILFQMSQREQKQTVLHIVETLP